MSKCPIFLPISEDIGKLVLRICIGGLMIPHGIYKIINGLDGIKGMLSGNGLPEFFAYGSYVGEVIAPILILIGFRARLGGLLIATTMSFAIFVTSGLNLFSITGYGGFNAELQLLYLLGGLTIMLIGSGKFSIDKK